MRNLPLRVRLRLPLQLRLRLGPRRPPRSLRPLPPPHHPARRSYLLPRFFAHCLFFFLSFFLFLLEHFLAFIRPRFSASPIRRSLRRAACSFPILSFSLSSPLTPPFSVALMHMIEPSPCPFSPGPLSLWRPHCSHFFFFSLSIATSLVRSQAASSFFHTVFAAATQPYTLRCFTFHLVRNSCSSIHAALELELARNACICSTASWRRPESKDEPARASEMPRARAPVRKCKRDSRTMRTALTFEVSKQLQMQNNIESFHATTCTNRK